jgi:hypothetical protein
MQPDLDYSQSLKNISDGNHVLTAGEYISWIVIM